MNKSRISYIEFAAMLNYDNVKIKHLGDYAIKIYVDNRVIATVIKCMNSRILTGIYHELPKQLRDDINYATYWLDRSEFL